MADNTTIEWTHREGTKGVTWNPTTGCDKISSGCDHCYALTLAKRLKGMGSAKYQTDGDPRTSGPGFGVAVHAAALTIPLRWRDPRTVFVNSMSDLFHARVPREFVAQVFAVMARTPQHTYQILTKRPERMARILAERCTCGVNHSLMEHRLGRALPLLNVWLGTSIESDEHVGRADHLRNTPAAVRFISAEPLLGPLPTLDLTGISWLIAGGESGARARPMHPAWVRDLRDRCGEAGVAFFFKQFGAWAPVDDSGPDGWRARRETDGLIRADGYHWPLVEPHGAEDGTEVLIRRVGKKAAGRELDGRTWDEYPAVAHAS